MAEEHLVSLAQHIHIWLTVLRVAETVLGALAVAQEIVVASLALQRQGITLVASEALLVFTAVHVGKLTGHDIAEAVLGIDEMVTRVDIAIVFDDHAIAADLAEGTQRWLYATPVGKGNVKELHKPVAHIVLHPLVEDIAHELSVSLCRY